MGWNNQPSTKNNEDGSEPLKPIECPNKWHKIKRENKLYDKT